MRHLRRPPGPGENESCPITALGSDSRVSEGEQGKKRERVSEALKGGGLEGRKEGTREGGTEGGGLLLLLPFERAEGGKIMGEKKRKSCSVLFSQEGLWAWRRHEGVVPHTSSPICHSLAALSNIAPLQIVSERRDNEMADLSSRCGLSTGAPGPCSRTPRAHA